MYLDCPLGGGAHVIGKPHGEDLDSRVRIGIGEEKGRVGRLEVTDAERCRQIKDGKQLFLHLSVNPVRQKGGDVSSFDLSNRSYPGPTPE
jgi:hypothetical protein